MFRAANKNELNQVSLTGIRAIVLLGLLMVAPRSLEEIRDTFIKFNIFEKDSSLDILRIDINTLKAIGCEISRADARTGYKYHLIKHPFDLNIDEQELILLKRAYNIVKQSSDISALLDYEDFFQKVAFLVCDTEIKEQILGISVLKHLDVSMVRDLLTDCKQKRVLNFVYKTPTSKEDSNRTVVAEKLVCKNDKIYLYGYDNDKKETSVFNIRRIKQIFSRRLEKGKESPNDFKILFYLQDFAYEEISEEESIIENNPDGYLVEGHYYNEFYAMQRILSFGQKCRVIEPMDFKDKVIQKLKEMKEIYEH